MDTKPSDKSLMPHDDFQKYKAILDIDCNAWWSARLGKLLCYNSIVIKVRADERLLGEVWMFSNQSTHGFINRSSQSMSDTGRGNTTKRPLRAGGS